MGNGVGDGAGISGRTGARLSAAGDPLSLGNKRVGSHLLRAPAEYPWRTTARQSRDDAQQSSSCDSIYSP